jgi:hypothetical protein
MQPHARSPVYCMKIPINPSDMKNLILSCALLLTLTSALAQNRETRNVDTFTKISFGVPGKALVSQGASQKVEVEGSKEVLEKIEIVVEGSTLKIRNRDKWSNWSWGREDRITVFITAKDIRGLNVSGSGDLETQTKIVSGDMEIKVSGSGNIRAEIEANSVDAGVSGSGNLRVRGKANNLSSGISGSGNIDLTIAVADQLETSISGSGNFSASGTASRFKATISGSGTVKAIEMEVTTCDIKIAGSGSASISVKNELNANISGSGSVTYKGNPDRVNANSSGSGKVKKIS